MEEVTGGPDSLVAVGAGWWSLILLPASLALNLTAFFSLVRRAGSCYRDPATPPLLSLTAANLLHCTLVQVSSAVSGMVITMGRQSLVVLPVSAVNCAAGVCSPPADGRAVPLLGPAVRRGPAHRRRPHRPPAPHPRSPGNTSHSSRHTETSSFLSEHAICVIGQDSPSILVKSTV